MHAIFSGNVCAAKIILQGTFGRGVPGSFARLHARHLYCTYVPVATASRKRKFFRETCVRTHVLFSGDFFDVGILFLGTFARVAPGGTEILCLLQAQHMNIMYVGVATPSRKLMLFF